ncbi:Replication factor C subunit 1-like protein 2 [Elsinoe fawcettii]|nr:Replication factor C subunit 1-like protein 2 [Elsinoe fawcettii]
MPQQIYLVLRTDYLDREDEGHLNIISIHETPLGARKAMEAHVKKHNGHTGSNDPNTNNFNFGKSLYGAQVIIGEPEYHSYDIRVVAEEVAADEDDDVDDDKAAEEAQEKATKKANGTKKAAAPKAKAAPKAAPKRKAPVEEDEEDEEAMPPPPSGAENALSGLKFLVTGTLEGMKRDEAKALIINHGGEYVNAMPKTDTATKPDYIVLGVKPGEKKIEEIRKSGFSTINQEELYEMIETRSADKPAGKAKKAKK